MYNILTQCSKNELLIRLELIIFSIFLFFIYSRFLRGLKGVHAFPLLNIFVHFLLRFTTTVTGVFFSTVNTSYLELLLKLLTYPCVTM